jgi:uncharacterized protein (TIGR02001 family)
MAACAVAGLLVSPAAWAQFSGSVGIDSDYRFRGVPLGGSKPSVRLSGNFDAASGWYAGASATQAQVKQGERYAQLVGYAGVVTPAFAGRSWDFGASYAHFTGSAHYDFAEAYAGIVSQRWSLRLNYSPDYFGRHVQTAYLDASGHLQLNDVARLFAHVGVLAPLAGRELGSTDANRTRADVRVGAAWTVGDLDLQVAWTAASPGGPFPAPSPHRRSGWLFSAAYSF